MISFWSSVRPGLHYFWSLIIIAWLFFPTAKEDGPRDQRRSLAFGIFLSFSVQLLYTLCAFILSPAWIGQIPVITSSIVFATTVGIQLTDCRYVGYWGCAFITLLLDVTVILASLNSLDDLFSVFLGLVRITLTAYLMTEDLLSEYISKRRGNGTSGEERNRAYHNLDTPRAAIADQNAAQDGLPPVHDDLDVAE